MTEAGWMTATDPMPMLELVSHTASVRRLRLFGVACCRRIWELMPDIKCELAVDIAEGYAEGYCDDEVLQSAFQRVISALGSLSLLSVTAEYAATAAAWVSSDDNLTRTADAAAAARAVKNTSRAAWGRDWEFERTSENRQQTALFREIFGNPFRPITFDPAWRTSDVMLLARGIYDEREFSAMPILADALQDAGCDSDDILNHLRDSHATHVRGCWALDLVLGKE